VTSASPRRFGKVVVDALEHVIKRRVAHQLQKGHLESMVKIGRNQPCSCGSGKKYKLCCMAADETTTSAARGTQPRTNAPSPAVPVRAGGPRSGPEPDDPYDRLDKMSNDAVDLIHDGKLDDAERLCHQLLDDFPDLPDAHIRFGQLFRARGEPRRAAHHLRLAAAACRALSDDPDMPASLDAEADSLDPAT
jgi:SEC-C motif